MDNGVSFKPPRAKGKALPGGEGVLESMMQSIAFLEDKVALLEELLKETNYKVEELRGLTKAEIFDGPSPIN